MNDEQFPENNKPWLDDLWAEEPMQFKSPVQSAFEQKRKEVAAKIEDERPNFDPYTGKKIEYPDDLPQEIQMFEHMIKPPVDLPLYGAFEEIPLPRQQNEVEAVQSRPDTLWEEPFEPHPFAAPLKNPFEPQFVPVQYTPETSDETVRQTGLAWSMGVVFFGSVAFMMFLGWGADLVFGSSPYGLVGGIVLGSIIGFVQFFRISSQIFGKNKGTSERHSFLSDD